MNEEEINKLIEESKGMWTYEIKNIMEKEFKVSDCINVLNEKELKKLIEDFYFYEFVNKDILKAFKERYFSKLYNRIEKRIIDKLCFIFQEVDIKHLKKIDYKPDFFITFDNFLTIMEKDVYLYSDDFKRLRSLEYVKLSYTTEKRYKNVYMLLLDGKKYITENKSIIYLLKRYKDKVKFSIQKEGVICKIELEKVVMLFLLNEFKTFEYEDYKIYSTSHNLFKETYIEVYKKSNLIYKGLYKDCKEKDAFTEYSGNMFQGDVIKGVVKNE